jgi:hypothetical protein
VGIGPGRVTVIHGSVGTGVLMATNGECIPRDDGPSRQTGGDRDRERAGTTQVSAQRVRGT